MIIKHVPNQFDKEGRQEWDLEYEYMSCREWFGKTLDGTEEGIVPVVNGKEVEWGYCPAKDEELIFIGKLAGGGGFGRFIGAIVGLALIVIGAYTQQYYLCATGGAMLLGTVVGMMGGGVNAPTIPSYDYGKDGFQNSQTYSWDGIQNIIGEGNPVPIVYGEHRIGGVVIEGFVDGESESGAQQRKYMNALMALSEGPIHGVNAGSIKINNNDLSNFADDCEYWTKNGEISQTAIDNFSKIVRHYAMTSNVRVAKGSDYIYKTYNDVDAARVTFFHNALFTSSEIDGSIQQLTIEVDVSVSPDIPSPTWTSLGPFTITNSTKSGFEHDIFVSFAVRGKYLIKVSRLTDDWDMDPRNVGVTYLKSVSEIENSVVGYPMTALLGVRLMATDRLSGPMPTITCVVQGRKLVDVRTGEETLDAAKNPANIIYDLCTNARYGLGRYITSEQIDLQSFKDFADWCDEEVEYDKWDFSTGEYAPKTQKRYEINLVLDSPHKANELITKIANTCRSIAFWSCDKLKIVVEKEQSTYAQTFSMSNIVKDSFEEEYVGLSDIPTQVEVQILDKDEDWKRAYLIGVDKSRLDQPTLSRTVQLYGLDDKARAKRESIFLMKKARGIRRSIKFKSSIQAIVCEVGDLIRFQHDTPQYGFGGHIVGVSGTEVTLNRLVPFEAGSQYRLRIRKKDNTYAAHTFTAGSTSTSNVIDMGENFDADITNGDIWVYGIVNLEAKPFRVLSIVRGEDYKVSLECEEYNSSIFNEDGSIDVKDVKYSHLGLVARYDVDGSIPDPPAGDPTLEPNNDASRFDMPPYVSNVDVWEELKLVGNVYKSDIMVSFEPVEMPVNSIARIVRYDVIFSLDGGVSWSKHGETTGSGYYRMENVRVGETYYIHIKPYTNFDITNHIELSANKLDNTVTVLGKVSAPSAPTNLTVTGDVFMNKLQWTNPTDADIFCIEVWAASAGNDRSAAVLVGSVPKTSNRFDHGGLHQDIAYYYWIRAIDTAGNASAWHPVGSAAGVSCQPTSNPAKVLDLLAGSITESTLTSALLTKINDAGNGAIEELLENQWTVKIQNNGYVSGAGLIMYPAWSAADAPYSINEMVEHNDVIYKSLQDNNSDTPPSAKWATVPYGAKSEFIILADKFAVVKPDGTGGVKVPFVVGNINGVSTVGIDGNLLVDGTLHANAIAAGEITADKMQTGTLTIGTLSHDVTDRMFSDLTKTSANTSNVGSIPAANIASWAHANDLTLINGGKIYTGSITAEVIGTTQLIANTANIADGIITNAKINDLNAGKITAGVLNADRIQAGSIVAGHIVSTAGFNLQRIAPSAMGTTTSGYDGVAVITHNVGRLVIAAGYNPICTSIAVTASNTSTVTFKTWALVQREAGGYGGTYWSTEPVSVTFDYIIF